MNYKSSKLSALLPKALKGLTVLCILISGLSIIFYSPTTISAQSTIDCADPSIIDSFPGSNCLFSSGSSIKKLCQSVPNAGYTLDADNILSNTTPIHRFNCMDLSDLQLCDHIDALYAACSNQPGSPTCTQFESQDAQNCAQNCNSATFNAVNVSDVRGVDYAVHNRDCVRFCDEVSAENTTFSSNIATDPDNTCISRGCHQLALGTAPIPGGNCTLKTCNLLTVSELSDVGQKLNDDETNGRTKGTYCNNQTDVEGNELKCYKFSEAQLPYTILNDMCQPHNCQPTCSTYSTDIDVNGDGLQDQKDNDDTLNISTQSASYEAAYIRYINAELVLSDPSLCNPVLCKPIVNRQFRCTTDGETMTGDNEKDIVANDKCDSTGDGSVCNGNMCYKVIDCNDSVNGSEPECITTTDDGEIITADDNSWFYRPQPMDKATEGNFIRTEMRDDLCYTKSQLKEGEDTSSDDGHWGVQMEIPLPFTNKTIDLGYAHSYLLPDRTRSPGLCDPSSSGNVTNDGFRGNGYVYLCYGNGGGGQLYSKVADHTAYHKGGVTTSYSEEEGNHSLRVCLRFRNSMRPADGASETCGRRECGISCLFGICKSQVCGYDVCRTLHIKDTYPDECKMKDGSDGIFDRDPEGRECMSTIDDYLRLRIQKYGNEICSYLDVKGHLAYEIDWFNDGSEKVNDLFCTSGDKIVDGKCNGFNTQSTPGEATLWRTIDFDGNGTIPYITSNQSIGEYSGYRNKNGGLVLAQKCIKTALRLPPPRLYNLANTTNSPKLFTPPIFLSNAFSIEGGLIATPPPGQTFGNTDFNKPEINVSFGLSTTRLSLGTDFDGYEYEKLEAEYQDSQGNTPGRKTISTTINNITYSAEVFVRKEYDENGDQPTFCLYRTMVAPDGTALSPSRIQCVLRNRPEYDNSMLRQILTTLPPKKIVIYPAPSNSFNDAKIILRYLSGFGDNGIDENCSGDDECSSELILDNPIQSSPSCSTEGEQYTICAQRDKCNKLNNECMQNEIDMQAAKILGNSLTPFLLVRQECNETLLPACNQKKGITANAGSSITNQNPSGVTANPNAYGWFNEICFISGSNSSGFDHELDQVLAYSSDQLPGGIKGKCEVNPFTSPYLTDNDPNTHCDDGGKAPNCLCQNYVEGDPIGPDQEVRTETYREAGFCVDIPVPETCPAIIANVNQNSDSNDLDYVYSSIASGLSSYDSTMIQDSTGLHRSHLNRTNAVGHADFPLAIMGTSSVEGTCKGFWKYQTASNGVQKIPTRDCINTNGTASWETSINNSAECERYTCSPVTTSGPISSAEPYSDYDNNYGDTEDDEDKGRSHGFALWPSYTKTNDYPESVAATSCIPGFKPSGSSVLPSGASSIKQEITGYSTGTTATRICNQRGQYETTTNICERITCPAINPPANPTTNSDWAEWAESGGATFAAINASRSNNFIAPESVQTGTCNNNLGFFQLGGNAPSRTCDSLGNWGPVSNECTTTCDAVGAANYSLPDENHGNTYWPKTDVSVGSELEVEAIGPSNGCATSDYKPYPYPSLKNQDGDLFNLTSGTPDYITTIPDNVANDTRTPDPKPKRMCKSVTLQNTTSNFWFAASSQCITGCPSYVEDPRINVGKTKHMTRSGEITINWPSTSFGTWVYASKTSSSVISSGSPNLNGATASDYSGTSRTSGNYMLARQCGTDGKWSDPIPQCVTNGGSISGSNAFYSSSTRNSTQTLDVGSTIGGSTGGIASTTTCNTAASFYPKGQDSGNPQTISSYTCEYNNSSQRIDEVYFKYRSGDACEQFCVANEGDTFGSYSNAKYEGTTTYRSPGSASTVNLVCSDGFGRIINDGEAGGLNGFGDSTYDDSCGRRSYDRGNASFNPKVTCNTNGTWNSTLINSCSKCRDCTPCSGTECAETSVADTSNPGRRNIFIANTLWAPTKTIIPACRENCSGSNNRDDTFMAGGWSRSQAGVGNGGDYQHHAYPTLTTSDTTETIRVNGRCSANYATFKFMCYDGYYYVDEKLCY